MAKVLIIVGVVLIILVITLYVAFSLCIIRPSMAKARFTTTMANLKMLHSAVNLFKMDTGRYPSQEEGLKAIVELPGETTVGWEPGGYLETSEIPLDGWGNEFVYELNPKSGEPFAIKSYGADGKEGGEGYDADLPSTDKYKRRN